MRKLPQTKWGKTERRYFQWFTNTRHYQGRIFRQSHSRRRKGGLGPFKICSKSIFGKQKGSKLWGAWKQPFAELPEIRLQHVTKNTLSSLAFGFFPGELWCSEWWTRRTFPSRHFFNGEEIAREMELCYARRLVLDFGKRCPYHGMQATGKMWGGRDFFVLSSEFTWKRLCRCSIYVVNIPKQNKSTKHILVHWKVFSFLFKPPFRIICQHIS